MKKNTKGFKAHLPVIVPVVCAIIVVCALAISGNITKNKDLVNPTVTQSPAVEEETESTTLGNSKVNIVAVGDNLIHNTVISSGEQSDGSLNYDALYENITSYIKQYDIAVINQETMLGGSSFEYSSYPLFNTPWEVGDAAVNAGFNVFTCATNHTMDVGVAGVEKELEFFSKYSNITHIGTYASQEEYDEITYITKNDITFALLNYTYGTNGISVPDDKSYVVSMLSEDKVTKDVTQARKNADVVIVFPHWGTENSHNVSEQQKKYVELFSNLGVDIVIGTHPHVIQPVEWYTNENTGKKMLVYYSLGNFVSHQTNLNQLCGGMAEITVERVDGEIQITSAKMAPTVNFYYNNGSGYEFTVYKFCDYTEDIASKHSKSDLTVDYVKNLVCDIVDEEFLDLN